MIDQAKQATMELVNSLKTSCYALPDIITNNTLDDGLLGYWDASCNEIHLSLDQDETELADTLLHELAHSVTDHLFGVSNTLEHGMEWRFIAIALGAKPSNSASKLIKASGKMYLYQASCGNYIVTKRKNSKNKLIHVLTLH